MGWETRLQKRSGCLYAVNVQVGVGSLPSRYAASLHQIKAARLLTRGRQARAYAHLIYEKIPIILFELFCCFDSHATHALKYGH